MAKVAFGGKQAPPFGKVRVPGGALAKDMAKDKKAGIKEGSSKDTRLDAKVSNRAKGGFPAFLASKKGK